MDSSLRKQVESGSVTKANSDRESRWSYLRQFSLAAAERTDAQLRDSLRLLVTHPHLGKPCRAEGTRELLIGRTHLIAVYRVESDRIWVVRLLHGSQNWPGRF